MNALSGLTASLALAAGCSAQTLGRVASISIVDRDSGARLTPHYYKGEYWVAGTPGARYAIAIRNRGNERLLAVTSVDGLNVLSGQSAAWDQAGYVFSPFDQYEITGWRKSDQEVAAFTFTAAPDSYAARTDRPENIGVIGVALFREASPRSSVTPPVARAHESAARQSPAAPPAPSAAASAGIDAAIAAAKSPPQRAQLQHYSEALPKLGTGHGEREYSWVSRTEFTRTQPVPDEVIRIRYDSLDHLVALGILSPVRLIPHVTPFPDSRDPAYVPDPPG